MELMEIQTILTSDIKKNHSSTSDSSPWKLQQAILSKRSLKISSLISNYHIEIPVKHCKSMSPCDLQTSTHIENQGSSYKKLGGQSQVSIGQNKKSDTTQTNFQHQMIEEQTESKATIKQCKQCKQQTRIYDPMYLEQKRGLFKYILRNARTRQMNRTSVIMTMEYFDVTYTKIKFERKKVVNYFIIFMVISSKMTDHVYFSLKSIAQNSNMNYQQLLNLEHEMYELLSYNFYKFTYVETATNVMKALRPYIDFFTQCEQSYIYYRKIFYIFDQILLETLDYNISSQIIQETFRQLITQRYSSNQQIQNKLFQLVRTQLQPFKSHQSNKADSKIISQLIEKFTQQKLEQVKKNFADRNGNYGDFINYYL